mmetsp:Transcript_13425/g.11921  ORF Transcript_13425/g.11921 Transcript_13425/m.11921 type:complete len:90 (+) Transcript_13425:526-795(+)
MKEIIIIKSNNSENEGKIEELSKLKDANQQNFEVEEECRREFGEFEKNINVQIENGINPIEETLKKLDGLLNKNNDDDGEGEGEGEGNE